MPGDIGAGCAPGMRRMMSETDQPAWIRRRAKTRGSDAGLTACGRAAPANAEADSLIFEKSPYYYARKKRFSQMFPAENFAETAVFSEKREDFLKKCPFGQKNRRKIQKNT